MKRQLILILCIVIPFCMAAQSKTDKTVENIAAYLNKHCAWGYVTDAVCGRNRSMWSRYGVDNKNMRATATLLDSIQPLLKRLPHKRMMTDEQADELFKGRIAMRLHPEQGDTSAYFLMDYDRINMSFKYGVNSPQSINIATDNSRNQGIRFDYEDLPAESVAPIFRKLSEMEQRSNVSVIDTVFQYHEGDKPDWWMGKKGEASRTPAHIVLLPNVEKTDFIAWSRVFYALMGNRNFTLFNTQNYENGMAWSNYVTATFRTGGSFYFFHVVYYQNCLCVIRVKVPKWEQCAVIPDAKELIEHLRGKQPTRQGIRFASEKFEKQIDSLMTAIQKRKGTEVIDTTFYSNDKEGHVWWDGINGSCPTHATVLRTHYSKKDHAALRQQLLETYKDNEQPITTDDKDCKFLLLTWRDMLLRLHGLIVYYYPEGQLVVVRANGLNPYQICIPHYSHDWFKSKK